MFRYLARYVLLLPPNHLIHNTHIALDNLHHLGAYIFIYVIGDGDAILTVFAEFYGGIYSLEEALGVDAGNNEVTLVYGFRTLGRGADADGREGMADAGEKTAFFRQGAAVADYGEGVHLEAVVVVKTEGLVLDNALVELEA